MLTIGVDYGIDSFGDLSTYVVTTRQNGKLFILDSGLLDDFCYERYVSIEHQIVGEQGDIERFREHFKTN